MSDETVINQTVPTIAGPRVPYSSATYTGEELRRAPTRPGATDALQIPSLFNGKRVERQDLRRMITAPAPAYVPPAPAAASPSTVAQTRPRRFAFSSGRIDAVSAQPAERRFVPAPPKPRQPAPPKAPPRTEEYRPRVTSTVGQCLARLRDGRGFMLFAEIDHLFGTTQQNRRQVFNDAIKAGLIKRLRVGSKGAYALPDFILPPELEPPPRMPAPKLRGLQHRLRLLQNLRRDLTLRLHETQDKIAAIEQQLAPYITEHGQPDAARATL